jgi:ketosteroid isomerase-like protein
MKKLAAGISLVIVLLLGTKSYAQSDMDQVKTVIDAYHGALNALDEAKMEALWVHDDSVMLVNPSNKSISTDWDAVSKNWKAQFDALSELKVTDSDGPHIQVKGDVAWSLGVVEAVLKMKSGVAATQSILETDFLEKRDGRWLLVVHTALSMAK